MFTKRLSGVSAKLLAQGVRHRKRGFAETRDRDVARLVVLLASFFRGFESGLYIFNTQSLLIRCNPNVISAISARYKVVNSSA